MHSFTRSMVLAVAAVPAFLSSAHAAVEDDLRNEIAALRAEQARIAQMQADTDRKLRELEGRLSGSGAPAEARAAAPASAAAVASAASPESRLKVTTDFRVRAQGDYDDRVRNHLSSQVRGRLGATYAVTDLVTVGARLATGDPDDPNSSDVQLSNFDDDLQVSLDQAYMQLNLGDTRVLAGKIPQPFTRTDLVWDSDVNPQGLGATYKHSLGAGSALRANGLFFVVDEDAVGADSIMTGLQLGYDFAMADRWRQEISAAYFDYSLGSVVGGDAGDFRSNLRNPDGSYQSDFDLADLIVGTTWAASDRWPLKLVGEYVKNLGAATDADTGFSVDLSLGRLSRLHDWRVTYGYSVAETDAVLAAFSHDNIALATNYRLHSLTFDYVPLPGTVMSAIWYHYQNDEPTVAGPNPWVDRIRLLFGVTF